MIADKNISTEEVDRRWHLGYHVWSVSMGGLGPGYEMGIQRIAFAMLREMLAEPYDYRSDRVAALPDDARAKDGRAYFDKIEQKVAVTAIIDEVGPTGAMYGAACNLADNIMRQGYTAALNSVPKSRLIIVSMNKV